MTNNPHRKLIVKFRGISQPKFETEHRGVNESFGNKLKHDELASESTKLRNNISLKRKYLDDSCSVDQPQGREYVGLEPGIGNSKSPSGLSNGTMIHKGKKHEEDVNRLDRKSGGNYTKKKLSRGDEGDYVKHEDINLKRKIVAETCSVDQSQGREYVGLGPSFVRVIGQDLMAASNCPGRRRIGTCRSPSGLSHGTMKHRGKTHEEDVNPLDRKSQNRNLCSIPLGPNTSVEKDDAGIIRDKVKDTLRLYQAVVRKLLQEEESKPKDVQANHRSKRADLLAAKILKEKNKWVNTGKQILGAVPGVEVGDEFHFRAELAIVGLHHPFQGGIDCVKRRGKVVATSIVTSWCYADDMDDSDVLIYLGQGGNPTGKDNKVEDQKLEGGNLALKNSIDEGTPVRVIRGFKGERVRRKKGDGLISTRGKLVATYTYDGLYLVERYWQDKGFSGTNVFKFQLRRFSGQNELAIRELKKSRETEVREGHCVDDISHGKEKIPIVAVNTIDDEKPLPFEYISNMIYPSWYNFTPPSGCKCTDNCADPVKCDCAVKNGGQIPFNHDGAIVEVKPLVYECGPSCGCPPSCYNRVSQHGIKFQLEIFKTESRGWGVRSLNSISSGSFVCEYTGELLQDNEAEQRTSNDEYLFDIGNNYNEHVRWEELSQLIPPDVKSTSSEDTAEDVTFTIDAAHYGSVGRFINHSCSPNLYAQDVLYDHGDKKMPHIMLFAAENIPPLQELTFHYNYKLDQVLDSNGNIKKKNCYCGSHQCTGRMY